MEVEELLLAWVAVLVARVDLFVNCHVDLSALEMEMTVYCGDVMLSELMVFALHIRMLTQNLCIDIHIIYVYICIYICYSLHSLKYMKNAHPMM